MIVAEIVPASSFVLKGSPRLDLHASCMGESQYRSALAPGGVFLKLKFTGRRHRDSKLDFFLMKV